MLYRLFQLKTGRINTRQNIQIIHWFEPRSFVNGQNSMESSHGVKCNLQLTIILIEYCLSICQYSSMWPSLK